MLLGMVCTPTGSYSQFLSQAPSQTSCEARQIHHCPTTVKGLHCNPQHNTQQPVGMNTTTTSIAASLTRWCTALSTQIATVTKRRQCGSRCWNSQVTAATMAGCHAAETLLPEPIASQHFTAQMFTAVHARSLCLLLAPANMPHTSHVERQLLRRARATTHDKAVVAADGTGH